VYWLVYVVELMLWRSALAPYRKRLALAFGRTAPSSCAAPPRSCTSWMPSRRRRSRSGSSSSSSRWEQRIARNRKNDRNLSNCTR